jgi:hypothetical protein
MEVVREVHAMIAGVATKDPSGRCSACSRNASGRDEDAAVARARPERVADLPPMKRSAAEPMPPWTPGPHRAGNIFVIPTRPGSIADHNRSSDRRHAGGDIRANARSNATRHAPASREWWNEVAPMQIERSPAR